MPYYGAWCAGKLSGESCAVLMPRAQAPTDPASSRCGFPPASGAPYDARGCLRPKPCPCYDPHICGCLWGRRELNPLHRSGSDPHAL